MDWFLIGTGLAMIWLPFRAGSAVDTSSIYAGSAVLIAGVAVHLLYSGAFA